MSATTFPDSGRSPSDVTGTLPVTSVNSAEDRKVWMNIAKVVGVLCIIALSLVVVVASLT